MNEAIDLEAGTDFVAYGAYSALRPSIGHTFAQMRTDLVSFTSTLIFGHTQQSLLLWLPDRAADASLIRRHRVPSAQALSIRRDAGDDADIRPRQLWAWLSF